MEDEKKICEKCNGTGKVHEKGGATHTCWDCLMAGRLDAHQTEVRDSGIKI